MNNNDGPSIGGFATNAINDIGNIATGLFSLPGAIGNAFKNPEQGGQMVKNLAVDTAKEYNNLAGQPVTFKNGQMAFQVPDIGKAAQQVYNHPINSVLDVLPFAKPLMEAGMAAKAGKAAGAVGDIAGKAAAEDAANIAAGGVDTGVAGSAMQNIVKPVTQGVTSTAKVPGVSDLQAKMFLQGYTVPRPVAEDGGFSPIDTAKQMIADGHSGSPQQIAAKVAPITGPDGVIERIKREILTRVPAPIDTTNAAKVIQNLGSSVPELAGNKARTAVYQSELRNMLPKSTSAPGNIIAGSPALDTYDSMRAIRDQGFDYINQGKDAQGHTINAEKVGVGKQFVNAANALRDEIENSVHDNNLVDQFKVPSVVTALQQFSPEFAKRFMNDTHDFTDLQALQKPYVNFGQMLRSTDRAAATAGSKFGGNISKAISTGIGGAVGTMAGGPMGAVAGMMGGGVAAPMVEAAADKFLPFASSKIASAIPSIRDAAGKVGNMFAAAAPLIAGGTENGGANSGDMSGGQTANAAGVQPNSDGTYSLPQAPSNPTGSYMTEAQREQLESTMTPGTPEYTKTEQQFAQGQKMAQNALGGEKMTFMQNAPAYVQIGNVVKGDIAKLPPNFLNNFHSWDAVRSYASNPNNPYAQELADIDALNTQYSSAYQQTGNKAPGNDQLIGTGMSTQQAMQKWDRMMQFFVGTYHQHLEPYLALTSPTAAQNNVNQPVAAPAQQQPQGGDTSGIMQNGATIPNLNIPQFQGGSPAIPQQ